MKKRQVSQLKTILFMSLGAVALAAVFQNCSPSKAPGDNGVPSAVTKAHDSDPALLASLPGTWAVEKFEGNFCAENVKATNNGKVCAMVQITATPHGFVFTVAADGEVAGRAACHEFSGKISAWPAKTAEVPPSHRDVQNLAVSDFTWSESGSCADDAKSESAALVQALGNARFFTVPATGAWLIVTSAGGELQIQGK